MKQAVRRNFEEKASYIAKSVLTMKAVDCGSFLLVDCGLKSDTFNTIVVRDLSNLDRLLVEGVGYFMAKQFPVAIWYWEDDVDKSAINALTLHGLEHNETNVAMYVDLAQANVNVNVPEGLIINYAKSASEIQQYGSVIGSLFGDSDEGTNVTAYFNLLSKHAMSEFPAMRYYIGQYQGEVVATGTLFIGSETIGIYDIATHAEYRHRGIGSAMFARLLEEAKSYQHRYAVLQASGNGIGIYLKAGFIPVGDVYVFENRILLYGSN